MAKKKTSNIGLSSPGVYYGTVLATGLPPELSTMSHVGDIVPDSLTREDDEDSEVVLKSQETQGVFADILQEEGTKKFMFSTWNFDVDNLLLAMGGTVDSDGTWSAPVSTFRGDFYAMAYVSRANEESELHTVVKYPKVKLKGGREGTQSESDGDKILFNAVLYKPEDSSGDLMPDRYIEKVPTAPLNGVVDDTADTFDWDYLQNWDAFADYETTEDGGTTWLTAIAKPHVVIGNPAVGQMQVRVKADTTSDTKHREGFTLSNVTAYTA